MCEIGKPIELIDVEPLSRPCARGTASGYEAACNRRSPGRGGGNRR
jgi:hypothetical protein